MFQEAWQGPANLVFSSWTCFPHSQPWVNLFVLEITAGLLDTVDQLSLVFFPPGFPVSVSAANRETEINYHKSRCTMSGSAPLPG